MPAPISLTDLSYGHLSHAEMASKVRMLLRHDLEHEGVCAGARDRIVWLAQREQDLLAEARRLRAERAAAPPVGQTVEQAILELVDACFEAGRDYCPTDESTALRERNNLLRAITARDAEVARAAAERGREACAVVVAGKPGAHVLCGHGDGYMDGRYDAERAIRSRAPAPAGQTMTGDDVRMFDAALARSTNIIDEGEVPAEKEPR